jgi:hypothetical protein
MRLRQHALVLALSVSLLAGCGGGSKKTPAATLGPVGTKGWTVLVYMTADNNLEGDALKDLAEMASVDSGTDLRFVVQADRAVGEATGPVLNLPDFTSTKRFLVRKGQVQDATDLGELNMGLTTSLSDFITWGIKTYPGEKYMLVFWDHGGGWKGFGWDDSTIATSGAADPLTLAEIATGVQAGLAATTVTKLDVIGFDACLMATVEVAESVKPFASYLLASEETEPGHGWDWAAFGGGGLLSPVDLGKKVIDGFFAQATAQKTVAGVTLSLVDLAKLGPIETAMTSLATAYPNATFVAPVLGSIANGRQKAVEYASSPDPAQAYFLVDAADLATGMSGVTGAADLKAAVIGAVVYEVHGAAKAGSAGLSIYFPTDSAYYKKAEYDTLSGMGSWRTFLTAVYGGGDVQAVPAFVSVTPPSSIAAGFTLSGGISSASAVASSYLMYGLDVGGTATTASGAILLGDQPIDQLIPLAGSTVSSTWDWSLPVISQGQGATAYMEMGYFSFEQVNANLYTASFPLLYYQAPGATPEFAVWQISLDGTGALVSNLVYLYSGGGVAQLNPAAGSRLRSLVRLMPALATWDFSWVPFDATGAGFDATKPLAIDLVPAPTTYTYATVLRIENSAGAGDWAWSWNITKP